MPDGQLTQVDEGPTLLASSCERHTLADYLVSWCMLAPGMSETVCPPVLVMNQKGRTCVSNG